MNHQVSPPTPRALRCTRRCSWPAGGPHVLAARCAAPPPGGSQTLWSCWGVTERKYWGSSSSPPQPSCFSPSAHRDAQNKVTSPPPWTNMLSWVGRELKRQSPDNKNKTSWKLESGPLLSRKGRFLSWCEWGYEESWNTVERRSCARSSDTARRFGWCNRCLLFSFICKFHHKQHKHTRTSCSC